MNSLPHCHPERVRRGGRPKDLSSAAPAAGFAGIDIRSALKEAMARLRAAQVPSHTLAAELLLMHALGCDRAWLYSHPEARVDPAAAEGYFSLIARRAAGEPTQYITGKQEFWGLEFEVTPAVLIPRPETEHVVEVALDRLGARGIKIRFDTGEPSAPLRIADVGTGSGCLAVALARELPHAQILATDISAPALEVARRNAARHGVADRIQFVQCNLLSELVAPDSSHADAPDAPPAAVHATNAPSLQSLSPLATRHSPLSFDLIVSNPPYIARNEAATLEREVRDHEPEAALFGGPSGNEIYARLIEQVGSLLRANGILVLELGYNSAGHVRALLAADPRWASISITNDLAGIPRVIAATMSS
jgi:release factor glutamine methyltransferase